MTDNPCEFDLKLAGYNYALADSVTRLTIFNRVSDAFGALRERVAWLEEECALRKGQQGKHLTEEIELRKLIKAAEALNRDMREALEQAETRFMLIANGNTSASPEIGAFEIRAILARAQP